MFLHSFPVNSSKSTWEESNYSSQYVQIIRYIKMHEFYNRTIEKNPHNTQDFGCQIYISYIFNFHVQVQLTLLSVAYRWDLYNLGFKCPPEEFQVIYFTRHCNQRRKIFLMLEQELTNPASICFLLFWMPEWFY